MTNKECEIETSKAIMEMRTDGVNAHKVFISL